MAATPWRINTGHADATWPTSPGTSPAVARRSPIASRSASTTVPDAIAKLRADETRPPPIAVACNREDVVFRFRGRVLIPGMGRTLYASERCSVTHSNECADARCAARSISTLRALVFGDDADALLPTAVMQPATFAIEYAWRVVDRCGIVPVAMAGNSVGEFVAATIAASYPERAIRWSREAAALMGRRSCGFDAVGAVAAEARRCGCRAMCRSLPRTHRGLRRLWHHAAIAALQGQLEADGVACRALRTSHAFHSAMMDAVVAPFRDAVASIARAAPQLPIVSTVSGEALDDASAVSPEYWARHLREPVRFAAAIAHIAKGTSRILLEVGPRATLATLARQHPAVQQQKLSAIATLADSPAAEDAAFRTAAGQMWCRGVAIDPAIFDERDVRRRVRLPTYPFERQRHWIEAAAAVASVATFPHTAIAANAALENLMPESSTRSASVPQASAAVAVVDRRPRLIAQLKAVFEDVAGFDLGDADAATTSGNSDSTA